MDLVHMDLSNFEDEYLNNYFIINKYIIQYILERYKDPIVRRMQTIIINI